MITKSEWEEARQWAWDYIKKAGVVVKDEDFNLIEVVDLGLGEIQSTGLQILTFFSTEWVGVKLLILRPHQFFPQHKHPPSKDGSYPGKTEIFRGQCGILYLYVPGKATTNPKANPPSHHKRYINVWHEIVIFPGDQYVNHPNTWHWFQAGIEGAAVWSFSSKVTDAEDQFMDPSIIRKTIVVEGCFSPKLQDGFQNDAYPGSRLAHGERDEPIRQADPATGNRTRAHRRAETIHRRKPVLR